jgi:hypothetical protein
VFRGKDTGEVGALEGLDTNTTSARMASLVFNSMGPFRNANNRAIIVSGEVHSALATYDFGRDCSADNSENSFYNCKLSGPCPANTDYAYFVEQSLGPDTYAKVYAESS